MEITWYGHSAFRVDLKKTSLLIDPFFTGNPAFEGTIEEAQKGISHIILTHGHGDHLGDTIPIAKATAATVIANYDLAMWLAAQGLSAVDPTNTGGTVYHDGFSVSYVQAAHSSAFLDKDGVSHSLGSANGIILKADGEPSLYHMGDTDIFGDMALIEEIYEPDIGLVPIGDRFTMNPEVAALACKRFFNFKKVIPCHYGSFPIIVQTADRFVSAMQNAKAEVLVAEKGQKIAL